MPKIRVAQTNFAQGEFSPKMTSRRDLQLFRGGAASLLNRRPLSQGGTATRPAFEHVAGSIASPSIAIPFLFRPGQGYVLVLSNGRLDAWTAAGTACTPVTGLAWTTAMLDTLSWCVAGDTILIFHETMPTQRIMRTGATTFSVSAVTWETPGFWRVTDPAVTISASAVGLVGSTATLTASAAIFAGRDGEWIRWNSKRGTLSSVGTTTATVTWRDDTSGLPLTATTAWQDQAWSAAFGYPSCGTVLDGRLWVASTTTQPSAVWASRVAAPFDFDLRTGADADSIAENIGGIESVPRIRHLAQSGRLLLLTDSGVWFIPSSDARPVTPSTIAFRPVGEIGAGTVRPTANDGAILYLDATGRVAREARWSDTLQSYTADAVSLLAEHLIKSPVSASGVLGDADQPGRLVCFVNADGTMAVQHSIAAERVNAWVPWETDGFVKSVAGVERTLFILVERDGTVRLERASESLAPLDAAKRVTVGSPTRVFTGFAHLAGRTVGVVSNGHDLGDVEVDGAGWIELPEDRPEVGVVDVGLRFDQVIRPLPVAADLPDGDGASLMKRLIRASVEVVGSGQFTVGRTAVVMGFQGDDFENPPEPFTGTKTVRMHGVSVECQFDIRVNTATRVTVLGLTREVHVNG
jgi:hypothetical protein